MQPTAYPDVNRMLDLILRRITAVLGDHLVGLYLSGSLVAGDFDALVSDIDLVAVTATGLSELEIDRLGRMHCELGRTEKTWDNRIEVAYISLEALKTFRDRASTIGIVSPGERFHTLEAGKDWLINWYNVRERGIALFGPPTATLIDPISKAEAIQWVREHALIWRAWACQKPQHRNGQVYAALTLCRALCSVTTGDFVSKRQSAVWTAKQLPEWAPFIEEALRAWREDWYDPEVDSEATWTETVRFVEIVVNRIGAITGGEGPPGTPST